MNKSFNMLDYSLSIHNDMHLSSFNCSIITQQDWNILKYFEYWVGGVGVCIVSLTGLLLNLTAICVLLQRLSNHNNFNQLIVALFVVDSLYLLLCFVISFQLRLGFNSRTLMILFPKATWPIKCVLLALSTFMTVGIAHERYFATKQPIIHRQRMLSAKFRRFRFLKYMACVVFFAVAFNVPGFFELEVIWKRATAVTHMNNTQDR